jgi:outer membrane lipoprotein-sorting protein
MTVDQLLDKYFEAIGGKEKVRKVNSRKSTVTMTMQGLEFPGVIYEMAPNKQRLEIQVNGQMVITGYDGQDGWTINRFVSGPDPVDMDDNQEASTAEETLQTPLLDYAQKGHQVKLLPENEMIDGKECYVIELTRQNGQIIFYYFDIEYFIQIMIKTMVTEGPSKGSYIKEYLTDYARVDGILEPFNYKTKFNDQIISEIKVIEIEINPNLDPKIFRRPGQ